MFAKIKILKETINKPVASKPVSAKPATSKVDQEFIPESEPEPLVSLVVQLRMRYPSSMNGDPVASLHSKILYNRVYAVSRKSKQISCDHADQPSGKAPRDDSGEILHSFNYHLRLFLLL